MNKLWKIIKYEYARHVLRKRFLFALISVPLWIVFVIAIGILAVIIGSDNTPLGYVDHSGLLANPIMPEEEGGPFADVKILPFPSEEAAHEALVDKKIQGYYILPQDYPQNRSAELIYFEEPDNGAKDAFSDFLRDNLLAQQPKDVARRVTNGPQLVIIATQEQREEENSDWLKIAGPIAAGVFLMTGVFTSGGYLMQAVVEEKENRTMEILATSVSPGQIMSGKTIALIAVGLTQILVWALFPLIAIGVAAAYVPFLRAAIDWGRIGLITLLVLPTLVLISSLMAAIGATVTESREGQQITGLLTLPVMSPMMLMSVLILNPGSPVALFLSFFPLTGALTILIRMAFSTVPPWQVYLSAGILVLSAIGSLWLSGRIFRFGMLSYGQRLKWKDVFAAIRSPAASKVAPAESKS